MSFDEELPVAGKSFFEGTLVRTGIGPYTKISNAHKSDIGETDSEKEQPDIPYTPEDISHNEESLATAMGPPPPKKQQRGKLSNRPHSLTRRSKEIWPNSGKEWQDRGQLTEPSQDSDCNGKTEVRSNR